ncbi:MAG TPA: hypothetical protein VM283_06840, partial [Armatimonadota bacterium]|nr:hypothetical protein [Armatimonadota bacterium]
MRRLMTVICAATMIVTVAAAEVTRTEGREGDERVVTLENEHLRLVLFPDLGGRIGHMVDLASGDDLLYWDLSPTAVYSGLGGALDDRRNSFEPYAFELPAGDPGAVRMTYTSDEVIITKTVSISEGGSTVRVDYSFANTSQELIKDYSVMAKNFLLPSGGAVGEQDLYCIPTSRGVRRITAFSGNWRQYPELGGKFKQGVGPWNAFVSTAKHRAIAAAFSNDYYRWFYMWKGGVEFPTYEWVFGPLPAGMQAQVTLWMHVASGLDGVSYAGEHIVADMRHDAGQLTTRVFAADRALEGAVIETEVQRLPDGEPSNLPPANLPAILPTGVSEVAVPWQPDADGTWVVRQRLVIGGETLAEWEEPIVIGQPSAEYVREPQFPAQVQLAQVPGWQRIEIADIVQPTAADRRRGFVAYLDEFAAEEDRGRPLASYELPMALGEQKTFGFKVRALDDLEGVNVRAIGAAAVEVFGVEQVDVSSESSGKTGLVGRKLVPWSRISMKAGEDAEVWVRVTSPDGPAARAAGGQTIEISARGREPVRVAVIPRVRRVSLPRPLLISHEAEHQLIGLPGCWNQDEGRWNQEVLERYARDLGDHNVDFEQGFWGWFKYARNPEKLLLATTGQPFKEYIAAGGDLDSPPPLDFSYLDPVFDAAIENGLVRFSTNSSGGLPPEPEPAWVMREAARYLRDRGYPDRDIWCKHMDEQPADRHPQMVSEVQWLRDNGYRPYSTFHNILAAPQLMATLNPGFDMYQGGFTTIADRNARLAEGNLDPADALATYQGWGATWYSYSQNRRPGWLAAANELDLYHTHVYYRWNITDAVIFPSEDGPTDSPAWEAMRDGIADANLVALARRWIQRLDQRAGEQPALKRPAEAARAQLALAIGTEDSIIHSTRTRDRLVWVDSLEDFDVPRAERARGIVLDLLADLRPRIEALGPSLYYGRYTLAEEGVVGAFLDPA